MREPIEEAMAIFVEWAEQNNRNYFGDLVRENLVLFLAEGCSPSQAVDALVEWSKKPGSPRPKVRT